jgi:hypothetical protein
MLLRIEMRGALMRVMKILMTIAFLFSSNPFAFAEPPSGIDPSERITFPGECYGRSDKPHISMHVPGTVNVVARTFCPKTGVSISSRLVRIYQGVEVEKSASKNGVGLVTLSISMKCIWREGMPLIRYRIYSKHRLTNGRTGETTQSASIKC